MFERLCKCLLIPAIPAQPARSPIPPRLWDIIGLMLQIGMIDDPLYLPAVHVPISFVIIDCAEELNANDSELALLKSQIQESLAEIEFLLREHQSAQGRTLICITPPEYHRFHPPYAFLANSGLRTDSLPLHQTPDFKQLDSHFRKMAVEAIKGFNRLRYHSGFGAKILEPQHRIIYEARLAVEAVIKVTRLNNDVQIQSLFDLANDSSLATKVFDKEYKDLIELPRSSQLFRSEDDRDSNLENHIDRRKRSILYLAGLKHATIRRVRRTKLADLIDQDDSGHYGVYTDPPDKNTVKEGSITGDSPDEDSPIYTPAPPGEMHSGGRRGSFSQHHQNQRILFSRDLSVACSRDVLSIQDLAANLEHWFSEPWKEQAPERKLALFRCLTSLLTGVDSAVFDQLKIGTPKTGNKLLEKHGAYFDLELQSVVSLLPVNRTLKTMLELGPDGRPQGAVISVWPDIIRAMWQDLLGIWEPQPGKLWPPKNINPIEVCLEPVTPARLKRTFEFWSCLHFGLPPEEASLVAGRPVLMRKTSLSYLQTSYAKIRSEYLPVCESFLSTIIDHTSQPEKIRTNLPSLKKETNSVPRGVVGSWYCPSTKTVRNLLSSMRMRVLRLRRTPYQPIDEFREALCSYTFEIMQLVTGMRAMSEPPFTAASFFGGGRWLRLCEKGRDLWRIIPLHPIAAELVTMLDQANAEFLEHSGPERPDIFKFKNRKYLFWVVQDGTALPLTHERQAEAARRQGIDYPDMPSNAYRHFNRSKQLAFGVSTRITDFSLGHLQRGPHVMNNFSLVSLDSLGSEYLLFLDKLLDELGVEKLGVEE